MANRYFPSQFLYSFNRMLTAIQGSISIVQQVKATLVNQGVTLTAVAFGSSGNSITYAITGGGTAGSEVVTVVGNAISIQIESGVSTVTQVRTALNASVAAAALILASGTSGSAVSSPLSATALSGGVNGVSSFSAPGVSTITQTAVGQFTITLSDTYPSLVSAHFGVMKAVAQDLVPQMVSYDVLSAKTVVVKLLTGATPTDPTAAMTLFFSIFLRNSSVSI